MPAYPIAYAKVKNCIFDVQFPGKWSEFGIIGNDFFRPTIWPIQIQVLFAEFKNPKITGINLTMNHNESWVNDWFELKISIDHSVCLWMCCEWFLMILRIFEHNNYFHQMHFIVIKYLFKTWRVIFIFLTYHMRYHIFFHA